MSITEHIQEVAGHIADQRTEIDFLHRKSAGLFAAFLSVLTTLLFLLWMGSSATLLVATGLICAAAGLHHLATKREMKQVSQLLDQNMNYRDIIVEETFSGKSGDQAHS